MIQLWNEQKLSTIHACCTVKAVRVFVNKTLTTVSIAWNKTIPFYIKFLQRRNLGTSIRVAVNQNLPDKITCTLHIYIQFAAQVLCFNGYMHLTITAISLSNLWKLKMFSHDMTQHHVPNRKTVFSKMPTMYCNSCCKTIKNLKVFDFANCNCAESLRQAKTNHEIKIPIYFILHIVTGRCTIDV